MFVLPTTFNLKGPKVNVLIRDNILFKGVARLTRGGRSCSLALLSLSPMHNSGILKRNPQKDKEL